MKRLGGDPSRINPLCPVDLVIDHSVQADVFGSDDAAEQNEIIEFNRNRERFQFLKWGSKAFDNFKIVPPGSGIVHQVNLEYLARVVMDRDGLLYNDDTLQGLNSTYGNTKNSTLIYLIAIIHVIANIYINCSLKAQRSKQQKQRDYPSLLVVFN